MLCIQLLILVTSICYGYFVLNTLILKFSFFLWYPHSLLSGGSFDPAHPKPVDGYDIWETISSGKPSPRNEVVININTSQGAALRVGNMKILLNVPNVTWFKPPGLEARLSRRTSWLQSNKDDLSSESASYFLLVSYFFLCNFSWKSKLHLLSAQ